MSPDKLRKDVLLAKEETHQAIQEGMSMKQHAAKLEVEMNGLREREHMLTDQVGVLSTPVCFPHSTCSIN